MALKCSLVSLRVEPKSLRDAIGQLSSELGSGVVMLAVTQGDKASIVASVTPDLTSKVKAGISFVIQRLTCLAKVAVALIWHKVVVKQINSPWL